MGLTGSVREIGEVCEREEEEEEEEEGGEDSRGGKTRQTDLAPRESQVEEGGIYNIRGLEKIFK